MSTPQDSEFDLDLHFLPAWAQQPANKSIYATHEGESEPRDDRRRDRRDRPPRRDGGGQGGRGPQGRRDQGGRPGGGRRFDGPGGPRGQRGPRRDEPRGPRPEPQPLPEVEVQFRPDEAGVDSLARQIKMTGRAYPLFGVAQIILEKPERHSVTFGITKKPDGTVAQPLFVCALDDSLWLSEDEAVSYILDKHFALFYQAERTQTDPPKGVYTFVAQCGMSGAILGPPNYHDYQNQLRKLHAERFSRLPFDVYKSRVKIVRDEETVKKWIEEQSWKTEYNCLNVAEPLKLTTREDVEKHFRATHLANVVKQTESHQLTGVAARNMPCRPLQRLVRVRWEEQKRFPLQLATALSQQFASRGLQFFKVNRTVTHVAVARPHYLDLETNVVSDNVRRIVDFINTRPKCTRKQLFEALAPTAVATMQPPPAEGAATPELTPEATAIITDLHWLVHQGHVIEFANGALETAKKPIPKPPKQPAAEKAKAAAATQAEAATTAEPTAEAVVTPEEAAAAGEQATAATEQQPAAESTQQSDAPVAATEPSPAAPPQQQA